MIFLILMNLDVLTCWWLKINFRPSKLKIWVEIRLRNHVKSISAKYELNPTEIKYILQGRRSKKVKNHNFFDFDEFGRLDLSIVQINSRPPELKIWGEILLENHVKSISTKYELHPTGISMVLRILPSSMYLRTSQK